MTKVQKVSKRIEAIVNEVNSDTLADIACDHAYISINAVERLKARRSIACDLNAASLEKAKRNICKQNLCNKIETRLVNGLEGINDSEADTVVIAGVGGRLCIEILNSNPEKVRGFKKLILQPQSETELLRRYLHEAGFKITSENIICDNEIFYTVISAEAGTDCEYSECEYVFGKIQIIKNQTILKEYINIEIAKINEIVKTLPDNKEAPELEKRLKMLKEVQKCL